MTATDHHASYQHLESLRSTRAVAGRWALLSVVAFLGFGYAFVRLHGLLLGQSFEPIVITPSSLPNAIEAVALLVGTLVLVAVPHELLHGVAMHRYNGDARYGVQLARFVFPYAYAESDATYERNTMLVILVTPFVVISSLGVLLALGLEATWPLFFVAANAAGSVGDLWTALRLLRYPSTVRVGPPPADEGALGVYGRSDVPTRTGPLPAVVLGAVVGAVGTFASLVAGFVALVFLSLGFDTGAVVLGTSDGWLLFRHELLPGEGAVIEVGEGLIAALSVTGGMLWAALTTVEG
ncbi:DUF3267 domain-containing protein [Natronosalvus vescus]|uniref:DUF3267 domain-containing protein n=1 Tax=Natronosalvus vescus TaxID=2953881 RepID=UPI00209015CE|nr:DUF3267 domain-containing protein [Natronosalvus vescus]